MLFEEVYSKMDDHYKVKIFHAFNEKAVFGVRCVNGTVTSISIKLKGRHQYDSSTDKEYSVDIEPFQFPELLVNKLNRAFKHVSVRKQKARPISVDLYYIVTSWKGSLPSYQNLTPDDTTGILKKAVAFLAELHEEAHQ